MKKNKILSFLCMVLLSVFALSCSSDDDNNNQDGKEVKLERKDLEKFQNLKLVNVVANKPVDWNGDGSFTNAVFSEYTECEKQEYISFDPTNITMTNQCDGDNFKGSWAISAQLADEIIVHDLDEPNADSIKFVCKEITGIYQNGVIKGKRLVFMTWNDEHGAYFTYTYEI